MYVHTFLYVYNALLYIYCEYTAYYVCKSVKNASVRTTKSAIYLQNALYKIAYNILPIDTFLKMNGFELRLFKGQHVDGLGCRTLLSGLISMFAFNSLQIPNGCSAPTCFPCQRAYSLETESAVLCHWTQ